MPRVHARPAEGHACPGRGASTRPPSGRAQAGAPGRAPPSRGRTMRPFTPGGAAGAWSPPWGAGQLWPCTSLPAVWKLQELSLSTAVRGTAEIRGPCVSRRPYPRGHVTASEPLSAHAVPTGGP